MYWYKDYYICGMLQRLPCAGVDAKITVQEVVAKSTKHRLISTKGAGSKLQGAKLELESEWELSCSLVGPVSRACFALRGQGKVLSVSVSVNC